jgi:predicted glycosyltransferase
MLFVVDIQHPVDVNFFRTVIAKLRSDGHEVLLVYLRRGQVGDIVRHDYPDLEAVAVGHHASSRAGLYLRTGLWRELELLRALRGRPVRAALGFPGFQTALVGKVLGFKSVGAYDDPEHRPNFVLSRLLLDRFVLPDSIGQTGPNIVPFRGLKEWAYLAPRHFTPSPRVLDRYGLKPGEYVFAREVEPRSLNYREQGDRLVEGLYRAGLSDEPVVLSLEDKRRRDRFKGWTILEEPLLDVHSLMYYSRFVLSDGDSMAREGAQLGVPSAYCGRRQMKANDVLYDLGLMSQQTEVGPLLAAARREGASEDDKSRARGRLDELWDDPAEIVIRALAELTGPRRTA